MIVSRKVCVIDGQPEFYCPGCETTHYVPAPRGWDGHAERPTISGHVENPGCSVAVRSGYLFFGPNCNHKFSGSACVLPDHPAYMLPKHEPVLAPRKRA